MPSVSQHLEWCLRQSKGIRLVEPSGNLEKAYREKSKNALKAMLVNSQAGLVEWAVSASYYAKYFAVYSLLVKVGVECEIHDCTIAVFECLFDQFFSREVFEDLRGSRANRVEVQYYTRQVDVDLEQIIRGAKKFVLEVEKVADGLTSEKILELQRRLKSLASR